MELKEQTAEETCGGNYECKNIVTRHSGTDDHGLCLDCGYDWTATLDVVDGWDEEEDEDDEEHDDW